MAMDLPDGSFDRVCSQFGVQFFPDRGLPETHRLTRPGGRGVVIAFGAQDRVPMSLFGVALKMALPALELPLDPVLVTEPDRLKPMMEAAGFIDVAVHTRSKPLPLASADDVWEWMVMGAPGYAMLLESLDEDRRSSVRLALGKAVADRYGDRFAQLPLEVVVGIGHKAGPSGEAAD